MSIDKLNDDKKVLKDRKKLAIETVSLRDQIVEKLFNALDNDDIGNRVVNLWERAVADDTEYMDNLETYLADWDEFLTVQPQGVFETSSNLHIPMTLWVVRSVHARFMQAILSDDNISPKARKAAYSHITEDLANLLKHSLYEWSNNHEGIEEAIDQWLWAWITNGVSYTKTRWEATFRKYIDIKETKKPSVPKIEVDIDGNEIAIPTFVMEEEEIEIVEKVFDGPCVDFINNEDIKVIGKDKVDIDKADAVIQRQFLTASELWTLVDRGLFKEEAVEELIQGGEDLQSGATGASIKMQRNLNAGSSQLDKEYDLDRYEILEAYLQTDVDGSGINSDVIVWVAKRTKTLLRATYLHRICKKGKRPFSSIIYHKRSGNNQELPVGLPELLHPIQKELDAIHNMRIDFGMISTVPFGFYRPGSGVEPNEIKMEPGVLIPLDNPQSDVFFPNLGNRTFFGQQEEQNLYVMVERLTGISDLSLGVISGKQGATRTATGSRALLGETATNLNVPLKRLNRGWKRLLEIFLAQLQERIPKGHQYRVTGEDGLDKYMEIIDKEQIKGDFDFDINAGSEASNKQIQLDNALQLLQVTANPLDIQLGIVGPANRYEAIKNYLKVLGIKNHSRFISSSFENQVVLTPKEEFDRVLSGQDLPVLPNADHQGFLNLFNNFFNDDNKLGMINEEQALKIKNQRDKHEEMLKAIQAAQAQQDNIDQVRLNQNLAATASPLIGA
ncbi:MAG: hypothetical protein GTN36_05440 [Candidatus Aenigmarchaeota archaeon]|nr:hypothetical protein [Candidatus Aenigmarchaeota archaeon]